MSTPEDFENEKAEASDSVSETPVTSSSSTVAKGSFPGMGVWIGIAVAVIAVIALVMFLGPMSNKGVAAKVNGEKIMKSTLDAQVVQLQKQYPDMFKGADGEGRLLDFKQRLLDNLINQVLVQQAAKERDISVSDADVEKQISQLKSGFKDDAQYQAALKSAGMTEEALKTQIHDQLTNQKIIESLAKDTKIPEKDLKAYYDKNKAQFQQKAAKRAQHILFKPEDKAKAQQVLDELKNGADFSALAKKNSVDTATASKGGDLGWPSTTYVKEFEAALAKLDKGEMSGLVKTPYGWHIIKVTDERGASTQSFNQVKAQIEQILIQQVRADSYQKYLDQLRQKAKIEILIDELKPSATPKKTTSKK